MAASHVLNGGSPSLFRDTGFAIVPTKSPPGGERLCGTARLPVLSDLPLLRICRIIDVVALRTGDDVASFVVVALIDVASVAHGFVALALAAPCREEGILICVGARFVLFARSVLPQYRCGAPWINC